MGNTDDTAVELTYEIRPTENAKPLTIVVKCCLCRKPLLRGKGGWCEECETWPINITPVRHCERDHLVTTDGWCAECDYYLLTVLEPKDSQWIDTRVVANRLGKAQIKALVAGIVGKLAGPGWPEKIVPLRRDMIPRHWKRKPLRVVGQTPIGYDLVLPAEWESYDTLK